MKTKTRILTKLVSIFCTGTFLSFVFSAAHADYLVPACPDRACVSTVTVFGGCYKHKHRIVKKYFKPKTYCKKIYRCCRPACPSVPTCGPCCKPRCIVPHDFVEFSYSPCCGSGRYVVDDFYYAPDLATGDDDPMIDPNMNIDK